MIGSIGLDHPKMDGIAHGLIRGQNHPITAEQ